MPRPVFAAFALCALASLVACAGQPSSSPRPSAAIITQAEIAEAGPTTAYHLIERLRPIWLQRRGVTSFTEEEDVVVYLDRARMGNRDALRNIQTEDIEQIEFFDARRATFRFGQGHVHGAIVVTTKR